MHMKKHDLSVSPIAKGIMFVSCAALLAGSASAWAQAADGVGAQGGTAASPLPRITNSGAVGRSVPNVVTTRPGGNGNKGRASFESYVQAVTGNSLGIFGAELFTDVPNTFAPVDSVQVNPDYVIGTGDELQIRGWGMVDIDLTATVDRSGAIYIPRVGSVKVAGIKYRDMQGYLKNAISRNFSNFELTVSVSQTRAVQVYVVGHAVRPGTYTLSAMSTLLNALFTSGGPAASGSMRNIQVKRNGQTITTFDTYDMIIKGDKSRDVPLQDGDVIYIPEVGPMVALSGNVKKPAIFELKGNSSMADVLAWAGGFDSASESKEVVIEKSVENSFQTVAKIVADNGAVSKSLTQVPLQPADVLRIFSPGAVPVEAQVRNEYVRVAGEVKQSGVFLLRKGETLRELIARLGGVTENGYLYAMSLNRESVKRAQQVKLDQAADRFERELEDSAKQRLAGAVDAQNIAAITAEIERQRLLVQQMRNVKAEGRIVLELPGGNAEVKHLPDIALHNGDSVYIPRKPGTVDVIGAVNQPSTFIYKPQRTLNDYLDIAGGITISASRSETYVIRADGTAESGRSSGLFGAVAGMGAVHLNPGDAIVVPQTIERGSWMQNLKEWTSILYQFGLGAAGLKVLKD